MRPIYINGRYLEQPLTGVQRYAIEVVNGLDQLMAAESATRATPELTILTPRNARGPVLQHICYQEIGRLHGPLWEQIELPFAARNGVLLNLGSTGPLAHSHQILTIHDAAVYRIPRSFTLTFRLWYRLLLPLISRIAKRILTVSEFSKRELAQCLGVAEAKIEVVHNAATHILRQPADFSILESLEIHEREYVLCVGAGRSNKNTELVHEALCQISGPGLSLVRVGEADPEIFINGKTKQRAHAIDAGNISDAQLRALYERALCFAFPSYYEGFGIPPIEAMLCGCPSVVSNVSALPEICGEAALYTDPHDPVMLADQITALRNDYNLRQRIIDSGYRRARRYEWSDCAGSVLELALEQASD